MKRYLSVFALLADSTLYKIFAVLITMAAAESAWYYWRLHTEASFYLPEFERIMGNTKGFHIIFVIAFALIYGMLLKTAADFHGSSQTYTISRLSISRKKISLLAFLYTGGCLILLWAVQTGLYILFSSIYTELYRQTSYSIGLFLTSYYDAFFHGLFPRGFPEIHFRNAMLITGIAAQIGANAGNRVLRGFNAAGAIITAIYLFTMNSAYVQINQFLSFLCGPALILMFATSCFKADGEPEEALS